MKNTLIALAIATICILLACNKQADVVSRQSTGGVVGSHVHDLYGRSSARLSGPHYSKSISPDSANRMISSYLLGVGYPAVDTAVRALSFDADTLRAYLANPNIVTVKFVVAHQMSYVNSGLYGTNSGLNPNAITLVITGLDNENRYILNSQGGVYDNMSVCPNVCPEGSGNLIQ